MGDGTTYTTKHAKHAYEEKGIYTVTLKVKDILNCEDSLTKINSVKVDLPKANFEANNLTTYCTPLKLNLPIPPRSIIVPIGVTRTRSRHFHTN
jgi:hypothetical protein